MVYISTFFAGFCIMVFELAGVRLITPFFGSSIFVWGSVLTVFMVSLSLGYLFGGWASKNNLSEKVFGTLFLLAGAFVAYVVPANALLTELIFFGINDVRYSALLAASILFAPGCFFLGAISPYAVALTVTSVATSGKEASHIYFLSTIGSALGTLATSFYLVGFLNISTINFTCSLLLIACGLQPILLGFRK